MKQEKSIQVTNQIRAPPYIKLKLTTNLNFDIIYGEYKMRTKRDFELEWARSVNDKNNMPYKDKKYGNKVKGNIWAVHYLVYNILRGLPKERGFEPLGEGYKEALAAIESSFRYGRVDRLLMPFKNTVTADELRALL